MAVISKYVVIRRLSFNNQSIFLPRYALQCASLLELVYLGDFYTHFVLINDLIE